MGAGGSSFSTADTRWQVSVGTRWPEPGLKTTVYIRFEDDNGNQTSPLQLGGQFNAGHTKHAPLADLSASDGTPLANIAHAQLWHEQSNSLDWFCDLLSLTDFTHGKVVQFPVQRWLQSKVQYIIRPYDTSLPQDDPNSEQRRREIEHTRENYKFDPNADPIIPATMEVLPQGERFPGWHLNMVEELKGAAFKGVVKTVLFGRSMKTYEDFSSLYKYIDAEMPKCNEFWQSDEWFALMRLAGTSPLQIKLCHKIPADFTVDSAMLEPHLEGFTLETALQQKKIFLHDITLLDELKEYDPDVVSPYGLFYMNKSNKLMPVAIQLKKHPSSNNPVFTPSDPAKTWLLAKLWFNCADALFHETVPHIGLHVVLSATHIAMHRSMSASHPVLRMLNQHLTYALEVNWTIIPELLKPDGGFDKLTGTRAAGAVQLMKLGNKDWKFNVEGTFKESLEARGLLTPEVLPYYPYRDDGMLLYAAMERYVTEILRHYYGDDDSKLHADHEVKEWMRLLVTPVEQKGAGIKGIPNNGELEDVNSLIHFCTEIIFLAVVTHAALNEPQYNCVGFPLNASFKLEGGPPTSKQSLKDEDIIRAMPDKKKLLLQIVLLFVASATKFKKLGDWDVRSQYDPPALRAEDRFREELLKIHHTIVERNKDREEMYKYYYLDPKRMPNSPNA